jgi:hypothetical protein
MVKVLVGKRQGPSFPGFWAELEGEQISSYEDTRAEKSIVYTLYECTAYDDEVYRVHVADESNPENPVYELRPYDPDSVSQGIGWDYSEPWEKDQIAAKYPLFLKDLKGFFRERRVDPSPRNW